MKGDDTMPFGKWENFNECVLDMQEQGYDEETSKKICGTLERELKEKGEKDVNAKKDQNANDSYEQRLNKVRMAFMSNSDIELGEIQVIHVFDKSVIAQEYMTSKYYEIGYSFDGEGNIVKGKPNEVDLVYIKKMLSDLSPELTGPIFKADEKQRIVYAAVLVPGEPDHDFDKGEKILSAEEIEQVAHKWLEDYGNIDYMHGLNNVAKPVESYILPMDMEITIEGKKSLLPKGSWILAGKITNDKAWKQVEDGELTGFSIMGIQNNVLKDVIKKITEENQEESAKKQFESALKRVLIRDLGKDWIVPFVSLVDEPCVPKAKFFAVKQKEEQEDKEGVWDKLVKFFNKDDFGQMTDAANKLKEMITEKAGRSISDETYSDLKKAIESLKKLLEKADKERKPDYMKNKKSEGDELDMEAKDVQKMIDERLDEKLKPIQEGLAQLTKSEEQEEGEKKEEVKEDAIKSKEEDIKAEYDKLKDEVTKAQETIKKLLAEKEGKSKVEKGQEDNEPEKKEYTIKDQLDELGRDSYGRAVKKGDE
jgi:hypothetical protein